jgi:phage gpG-like protein
MASRRRRCPCRAFPHSAPIRCSPSSAIYCAGRRFSISIRKAARPANGQRSSRRPSRKLGGQILFDTGRLSGSIGIVAGHNQVEVGTSVAYARFHQHGTRNMVARPFVGLTAADHDEIERATHIFIVSLIA